MNPHSINTSAGTPRSASNSYFANHHLLNTAVGAHGVRPQSIIRVSAIYFAIASLHSINTSAGTPRIASSRFQKILIIVLALTILYPLLPVMTTYAQSDLPSCNDRPGILELPFVNFRLWCLEEVIAESEKGEFPFTALAFAPDGALYTTRPLYGELLRLRDSDNDGQPDSPEIIAENLTLPNALVYYDDALYIAGGQHIYRWQDDALTVLVDDLPAGEGFWTGGLTVFENRLYVGIGAPCDACMWENPERGAILSFDLNGDDKRLIAQGLRRAGGLTVFEGDLWVTDSARDDLAETPFLDELNRVPIEALTGDNPAHFGFPHCIGAENTPDIAPDDFDCSQAIAPEFLFETHSTPLGLTAYHGEAFPFMPGRLIMVLSGSLYRSDLRGYQLISIDFYGEDAQFIVDSIVPYEGDAFTRPGNTIYQPPGYRDLRATFLNRRGGGLWVHRVYDVAISPEGWIYFSAGGGRILSLRPGNLDACDFENCD